MGFISICYVIEKITGDGTHAKPTFGFNLKTAKTTKFLSDFKVVV